MTDRRIVYGARCQWWSTIDQAGQTASGLPGCPKGHVLLEVENLETWLKHVDEIHPLYREFLIWMQNQHFDNIEQAMLFYCARESFDPKDMINMLWKLQYGTRHGT